jgi:iron complex outermembrane recepter protein
MFYIWGALIKTPNQSMKKIYLLFLLFPIFCVNLLAQSAIRGIVKDEKGETLIGVTIQLKGKTGTGVVTDFDGVFELKTEVLSPTLIFSYVGYTTQEVVVVDKKKYLAVTMKEEATTLGVVEIVSRNLVEKKNEDPRTIETIKDFKSIAASDPYNGMSTLKDVDATQASFGFTVINTRGFNSTSPVRSLQIIDGVDNQSPGLNFSLGNFLGSSELDLKEIDMIVGANSAYYGPNAFNGVVSMGTKNPFFSKGVSIQLKGGERSMAETAIRIADVKKNKDGNDVIGFKLNLFYLRANDWKADNYDPVGGSRSPKTNRGGYDAINIYGDEYSPTYNFTTPDMNTTGYVGMGVVHREGYKEEDLVDYNTRNIKANAAVHFRLRPSEKEQSAEFIVSSSFGSGTTVYQGDNRFSLKDILFFQNRLELRKAGKYFIRAYATNEDAGKSYDPYFTALLLQQKNKQNEGWASDYAYHWRTVYEPQILADENYPKDSTYYNEVTGVFQKFFEKEKALKWLEDNNDRLTGWANESKKYAETKQGSNGLGGFYPGTPAFQKEFDRITSTASSKRDLENGGTRFVDRSALFHLHGERKFEPSWGSVRVGANSRLYTPNSKGTLFYDTSGVRISNMEYGVYAGLEKKWSDDKFRFSATARMDKNQNFGYLFSPAASLIYTPTPKEKNNYFRLNFSSAIRNPTLTDQYLYLNVGRAILSGNLNGINDVYTPESFFRYLASRDKKTLEQIDIAPVRPEKVKTMEVGYRTTLFDKVYVDLGYYYSFYRDFIGYRICVQSDFDELTGLPQNTTVYRMAANSDNIVTTQGFSLGANYYLHKNVTVNGNFSWNKLNKDFPDDPIIPAYNTPLHKFNLGITGREVKFLLGSKLIEHVGFNVNYKWIEGFVFEGSPQFTGAVPTYTLLDAQVNYFIPKIKTTFKLGASNLLNNKQFQTYGGPRIGRLAYFSVLYEWMK